MNGFSPRIRVPLINDESYRRQTRVMKPVVIGHTTFTPEITSTNNEDDNVQYVTMQWVVSGADSKLAQRFDEVNSTELLQVELTVDVENSVVRLDLLRSGVAEHQDLFDAASDDELKFLKYLGRDSLCAALRYIIIVYRLDPLKTVIKLTASGTHRTANESKKLVKYYKTLGFTNKKREKRNLSGTIAKILMRCHNL